jgi:hypothetical protein
LRSILPIPNLCKDLCLITSKGCLSFYFRFHSTRKTIYDNLHEISEYFTVYSTLYEYVQVRYVLYTGQTFLMDSFSKFRFIKRASSSLCKRCFSAFCELSEVRCVGGVFAPRTFAIVSAFLQTFVFKKRAMYLYVSVCCVFLRYTNC